MRLIVFEISKLIKKFNISPISPLLKFLPFLDRLYHIHLRAARYSIFKEHTLSEYSR